MTPRLSVLLVTAGGAVALKDEIAPLQPGSEAWAEAARQLGEQILLMMQDSSNLLVQISQPIEAEKIVVVSTLEIIEAVCIEFGMMPAELRAGRDRNSVLARWVAYHLSRKLTGLSFPQIGRAFGKDHSTVQHGVRELNALFAQDEELLSRVVRCEVRACGRASVPNPVQARRREL